MIDDGKGKKAYEGTDKVLAEYKKRVEKLADMSVGGKAVQVP